MRVTSLCFLVFAVAVVATVRVVVAVDLAVARVIVLLVSSPKSNTQIRIGTKTQTKR